MALTDALIRALKPGAKDRWIGDGRGLYLRLRSTGAKTLVVRSKRGGPDADRHARGVAALRPREGAGRGGPDLGRPLGRRVPPPRRPSRRWREEYFNARIAPRYKRQKNARTYRDRLIREAGWRKIRDLAPVHLSAMVKATRRPRPWERTASSPS